MAETNTAARTEPKSKAEPTANLAPAAESSDPAVHQLLAEIQTAQANGDDDAVRAARTDLRKLGYQ